MWLMTMDYSSLIVSLSSLLIRNIILVSREICSISHTVLRIVAHDDSVVDCDVDVDGTGPWWYEQCDRREDALTNADVDAVVERLGLSGWSSQEEEFARCIECEAMGVVDELLESKTASEGELEEAFYVFDSGKDGFICAAELCSVMNGLGLEEGVRYEDCKRMLAAFDTDGDGKISFQEFRAMMENAV